jgi:hypothetical protein
MDKPPPISEPPRPIVLRPRPQHTPSLGLLHTLLPACSMSSASSTGIRAQRAFAAAVDSMSSAEELVVMSLNVTSNLQSLHSSSRLYAANEPPEILVEDGVVRLTDKLYDKTLAALAASRGTASQQAFARGITDRLMTLAANGDGRFLWHHFVCRQARLTALPAVYFQWLALSTVSSWQHGCAVAEQAVRMAPSTEGTAVAHRVAPCVPCDVTRAAWLRDVASLSSKLLSSPFVRPYGVSPAVDPHQLVTTARKTGGHWAAVLRLLEPQSEKSTLLQSVETLRRLHNGYGSKWRTSLMPLIAGLEGGQQGPRGPLGSDGQRGAGWLRALLLSPEVLLRECQQERVERQSMGTLFTAVMQRAEQATQHDRDCLIKAAIVISSSLSPSPPAEVMLALCKMSCESARSQRPTCARCSQVRQLFAAMRTAAPSPHLRLRRNHPHLRAAAAELVETILTCSRDTPKYFAEAVAAAGHLLRPEEKSKLFGAACLSLRRNPQADESFVSRHLVVLSEWTPTCAAACLQAGLAHCGEATARLLKELVSAAPQKEQRWHWRPMSCEAPKDVLRWLRFVVSTVDASRMARMPIPAASEAKSVIFLLLQRRPQLQSSAGLRTSLRSAVAALTEGSPAAGSTSDLELALAVDVALRGSSKQEVSGGHHDNEDTSVALLQSSSADCSKGVAAVDAHSQQSTPRADKLTDRDVASQCSNAAPATAVECHEVRDVATDLTTGEIIGAAKGPNRKASQVLATNYLETQVAASKILERNRSRNSPLPSLCSRQ